MDNITRLKTKIGEHEFEAEGTAEYVREQFQTWQELVKLAATMPAAPASQPAPTIGSISGEANGSARVSGTLDAVNVDSELTKIMRSDGRYISLTGRAASVHDAVLLLLFGQKVMRNNDGVTGGEILAGLASTGGFGTPRLDRILDKLADDGEVMSFGERRGKKYRLTNTGIAKARAIASELIAALA